LSEPNESSAASQGPHAGQPALSAGAVLGSARHAVILLHGRGASADDILTLAAELGRADFAYLAPEAAGHSWYPYTFLAPLERNEPWLSSALDTISALLRETAAAGISPEQTVLMGFSQGACLLLEFAARHARRYGGIVAFSGGLIGPDGTPRDYPGSLAGTPAFLGCSDVDPHVPRARVEESTEVLRRLGADVTMRLYAGMGHTVNADELAHARAILAAVAGVA
jgi:predicted esterase